MRCASALVLLAALTACEPPEAPAGSREGEGETAEGEGEGETAEGEGEGEGETAEGEGEGETAEGDLVVNEVGCQGLDFVEIRNNSTVAVDLSAVSVTDDVAAADRRSALSGTLAPGALQLVDALSFGVSCTDTVSLLVAGVVVDTLNLASDVGSVPASAAVGRLPDGTGAFALTQPTPGQSNTGWADPSAALFTTDTTRLPLIQLVVDDAAEDSLRSDGYTYVPGEVTITIGDTVVGPLTTGLRKKGKVGSFRQFDQKMAWKLDFNRFVPNQHALGLGKVNLNNLVQDPSAIHEWMAYRVFAAAGVPTPRQGYVDVEVNGERTGTYLAIEAPDDDAFLDRSFDSTSALFEGEYGEDFFDGAALSFDLDKGTDAAFDVLAAFISALHTVADDAVSTGLESLLDWDEVLSHMAVEVFIGHWDGYAPTRNNYFVHLDDAGRIQMMPWGVDQTFDYSLPLYEGQGLILQRCLADSVCRSAWEQKLLTVADHVEALLVDGLDVEASTLSNQLVDVFADDPRREWDHNNIPQLTANAISFMRARIDQVRDDLSCTLDTDADTDGDGFSCSLDCNEGDPAVHLGATEVCGNGIDEDCSGRLDDDDGCPDCVLDDNGGARPLLICRVPRSYGEAETACAQNAMRLVSIADETDNGVVIGRVFLRLGGEAFWLGLDDRAEEGVYVWSDARTWVVGDVEPFSAFVEGEPNDFGASEDCIHTTGDRWNDNDCNAGFAVVCEPTGR